MGPRTLLPAARPRHNLGMKVLVLMLAAAMAAHAGDAVDELAAKHRSLEVSMTHWALMCPSDTQDPTLLSFGAELGKLRARSDRAMDKKGLEDLQADFDSWKDRLAAMLQERSGRSDLGAADYRFQLEKGVSGLAEIAESDKPSVDPKRLSSKLGTLQGIIDPAAFSYYIERSKTRGAGILSAARKDEKLARRVFVGYNAKPRDLRPENGAVIPNPSVTPASFNAADLNATPTDEKLIAFVSKSRKEGGWGINATYAKLVVKFSHAFGINPMIPLAMMRQESSGYANAVSNKGASGLMQLMPDTARGLGVPLAKIFDAQWNIWGGIKYIKQVTAQLRARGYEGVQYVLAAYNAGPGAVFKYKGVPRYNETMNYVERIKSNIGELIRNANPRGDAPRSVAV